MMCALARALAGVPTGRLPIVPASISTWARALVSEKTMLSRVQPESVARAARVRKICPRVRIADSLSSRLQDSREQAPLVLRPCRAVHCWLSGCRHAGAGADDLQRRRHRPVE